MTITGTIRDEKGVPKVVEVELWKRNPVECVQELLQNARFAERLRFAPERVYHVAKGHVPMCGYDEMATSDWWWAVQVRILCSMHIITNES